MIRWQVVGNFDIAFSVMNDYSININSAENSMNSDYCKYSY